MKLEDLSKEEILEALKTLVDCDAIDPSLIYESRAQLTPGERSDDIWRRCDKYREAINDFVYPP